jgi:hypothetical protein
MGPRAPPLPGARPLVVRMASMLRHLPWLLLLLAAGCVRVKPYQRELLTERSMAPGFGDPAEVKFRAHAEGSRMGIEGGFGNAGGGCGCNARLGR